MNVGTTPPPKLLQALRYVLRPLVRLLLDHNLTFPAMEELLKRVYVDVADKDFALPDKAQTDSRISVLTGVHRKDVKRLRESGEEPLSLARGNRVSLQSQLLAKWLGEHAYLDEHNYPLPLPRLAQQDGTPSFEQMVNAVSKDVRPRVFLDEWLHTGLVHLDDDDLLHLNVQALLQSPAQEEKLDFFGRNIHDHLAAVVSNLEGRSKPYMDRCVFYHGLTPAQVRQLNQKAEELSMTALLEVNRAARKMIEQNRTAMPGDESAPQRIHFGFYFYHDTDSQSSGPDAD
jgi:hypothetical protein